MYRKKFSPQVRELVSNGRFNWGTYAEAIPRLNMLDAKKPWGFPAPRFIKNFRLKEWQAFQLGNAEYFLLVVIYSAKILGLVQFVFIDKKKNKKIIFERKVPSRKILVAPHLFNAYSHYQDRSNMMMFHNDIANEVIDINFDLAENRSLPRTQGHFTGLHGASKKASITICHPFGGNRALYSHKCLMSMTGEVKIGEDTYIFDSQDSWMIIDDHKGYYPRTMQYDWLTTAGINSTGDRIGFNLTNNQIVNHYRFNENCLWINNSIELLPPVIVQRPNGVHRAWYLTDDYGRINLKFIPCIPGSIYLNTPIGRVDYHAPYGWIDGYIVAEDNRKISFDSFFGMGEKKFIQF